MPAATAQCAELLHGRGIAGDMDESLREHASHLVLFQSLFAERQVETMDITLHTTLFMALVDHVASG